MSEVKSYDAKQVSVIVGTRAMKGFAEGSFVTVARDEQAFTKKVGADGEVTRSKTNNRAGTITIVLEDSSESNDYLSELASADETSNTGIVPVTVRDASGRSIHFARQAWVQRIPDDEKGRDSGENEWVLDCGPIESFVGGN